ncbi:chemotaxis protein CheA [Nevskia soli]|uniref:chemotaxis protein CheA n=1 Tax=Nevskia soli TaxID=418856 RepID=UPI0004A71C30|nr:chemotaxis protein CheA [Nevskia soli]
MSTDTDDDIRADFLAESGELMAALGQQLVELERRPADGELLNAVFRGFHTIKGGAGFLGLEAMVALCHAAEEVFNALRKGECRMDPDLMDAALEALESLQVMHAAAEAGRTPASAKAGLIGRLRQATQAPPPVAVAAPATGAAADNGAITDDEFEALLDQLHGEGRGPGSVTVESNAAIEPSPEADAHPLARQTAAESSVRVDTAALDGMMNLVGELVLVRNRLKRLCGRADQGPEARAVGELDHITRSLQAAVMRVRMQPIRRVFSRFPRLAREVARGLGKQVEVELVGEDTGLDKSLVEALADPLVHMVRNSVDHGIEPPAQRLSAGKPVIGRLRLSARQAGDQILITVEDDGAGMDAERLRGKAVEKGLLAAADAARLSLQECLQLIFRPGFSTKDQVSELSGRGVGMDVVKSSITALGGSVQIESRLGFGSSIHLRVPLTLAILPALMIGVGPRLLALPLAPVLDVFELDPAQLRRLDRWDVLLHRKETLRLIHLHRWLDLLAAADAPRHVVVAQVENERYGFVVSQVHAREEVVIKPLGAMLRGLAGIAGATVTGSGRVALILDLPGLVRAGPGAE